MAIRKNDVGKLLVRVAKRYGWPVTTGDEVRRAAWEIIQHAETQGVDIRSRASFCPYLRELLGAEDQAA